MKRDSRLNCILAQVLRRQGPCSHFPKNWLFEPLSGRFLPIRPTNQRGEQKQPQSSPSAREPWWGPNVPTVAMKDLSIVSI